MNYEFKTKNLYGYVKRFSLIFIYIYVCCDVLAIFLLLVTPIFLVKLFFTILMICLIIDIHSK